jgi:hypothetical protein
MQEEDRTGKSEALLLRLSNARVKRIEHQRWHVLASYDAHGALAQVEFIDAVAVSRLPLRLTLPSRAAVETSIRSSDSAANDPRI